MANSADFDQTVPKEQSDQSFHCLVLPLFQYLESFPYTIRE